MIGVLHPFNFAHIPNWTSEYAKKRGSNFYLPILIDK